MGVLARLGRRSAGGGGRRHRRPVYRLPLTTEIGFRGGRLVVVPADFVMSRDMLNGVKTRAERYAAEPQRETS
jgi:hypothetical protein